MGRLLQLLYQVGRDSLKMLHFATLLSAVALASASGYGHHGQYNYGQAVCTTVYDSATDTACHTEHDQACHTEHTQQCHEEYDTIVDTTHIEECQDIVTEQCHQVSQQVHHSSGVVGHNTHVVPGGHGVAVGHHGKREADASLGGVHGHSSGPQCHAKTERQCPQRPVQHARQVPSPVCVSVPHQVCVPVTIQVPRQECQSARAHVSQHGFPGRDHHAIGYGHH